MSSEEGTQAPMETVRLVFTRQEGREISVCCTTSDGKFERVVVHPLKALDIAADLIRMAKIALV